MGKSVGLVEVDELHQVGVALLRGLPMGGSAAHGCPVDLKCSGEMNSPCAEILPSAKCSHALTRAPPCGAPRGGRRESGWLVGLVEVDELHQVGVAPLRGLPMGGKAAHGCPVDLKCSGEMNSPCAEILPSAKCSHALTRAPPCGAPRGGRRKSGWLVGLVEVDELHQVGVAPLRGLPMGGKAAHGSPVNLKCSGEMNSPCAEILPSAKCSHALTRAPPCGAPRGGRRESG